MTKNYKCNCRCNCNCGDINNKCFIGPKGMRGPRGDVGPSGDKGDVGDAGDKGGKGCTGETGYKGPPGEAGVRGLKGDAGDAGDRGDKGKRGMDGDKGPRGDVGDAGFKGPPGDKGDKGDTGFKGPTGLLGPRGDKGETGNKGPTGVKGDTGPRGGLGLPGLDGDKGPKGVRGEKGPTGEKGFKGRDGLKGPSGDKGDDGKLGYKRFSPGLVMIKKAIRHIIPTRISTYVTVVAPNNINLVGINGNHGRITERKPSYMVFNNNNIVANENIISFTIDYGGEVFRNQFIDDMDRIFSEVKNCKKTVRETVPLTSDGDYSVVGDLSFDYEYMVVCNCSNKRGTDDITDFNGGTPVGNCMCMARNIKVCDIESYEVTMLRKRIERARDMGQRIRRVITYSGDFADLTDVRDPITIGPTCYGAVILIYNQVAIGGNITYSVSVVDLEKVAFIEFD